MHRYQSQTDEIGRLQLENGILQEKIANEKRKVTILEVSLIFLKRRFNLFELNKEKTKRNVFIIYTSRV